MLPSRTPSYPVRNEYKWQYSVPVHRIDSPDQATSDMASVSRIKTDRITPKSRLSKMSERAVCTKSKDNHCRVRRQHRCCLFSAHALTHRKRVLLGEYQFAVAREEKRVAGLAVIDNDSAFPAEKIGALDPVWWLHTDCCSALSRPIWMGLATRLHSCSSFARYQTRVATKRTP